MNEDKVLVKRVHWLIGKAQLGPLVESYSGQQVEGILYEKVANPAENPNHFHTPYRTTVYFWVHEVVG